MGNKILVADLVSLVAQSTGLAKNRCDDYVKAFFEAIANALSIDGIVKIKGFGTFKLITVEERKSVNVQTGSEMLIPAHTKVSFIPDKALKDDINKPYSHLKTYVLNPNAPLDPPETEDEDSVEEDEAAPENPVVEVVADSCPDATKTAEDGETLSNVDNQQDVNPENHSDWYDNWEVEYDSSAKVQDVDNNAEDAQSTTDNSAALLDNPVAEDNEADANKQDSDSAETIVTSEELTDSNVDSEESSAETVNSADITDEAPEILNATAEIDAVDEEVKDEPSTEDNHNSEIEDVNPDAANMVAEDTNVSSDSSESSVVPEKTTAVQETSNEKKKKFLGVGIIAFIVLLALVIFGLSKCSPDALKSLKVGSDEPPVMPSDSTSTLSQELSAYIPDTVQTDSVPAKEEEIIVQDEKNKKDSVKAAPVTKPDPLWDGEFVAYMKRHHSNCQLATGGSKGEVTIKKGLFLTMVALENYGDKSYWIYLYLYNKDRIKNPNNVPIGTKIRVPKLDKSLANGTDADKLAIAKEVRQVFVK